MKWTEIFMEQSRSLALSFKFTFSRKEVNLIELLRFEAIIPVQLKVLSTLVELGCRQRSDL